MNKLPAILLAVTLPATAAERVVFEAQSPQFEAARAEYEAIWLEDGERIIEALEQRTGVSVEPGTIQVIVYEGVSSSGYKQRPMRMRASYPPDTKRATLVHELSHRLIAEFFYKEDEDHPYLFLFLYDVWVDLWGKAFADAQVEIESQRRGIYDYEGAWKTALALGAEGRAAAWREFLELANLPGPLEAGWQGQRVCENLHEDDRQRVLRCTFPPGTGHERHSHRPYFGYAISGGRAELTDGSGTREVDFPTGSNGYNGGTPWHEIRNIGDSAIVYMLIEPK